MYSVSLNIVLQMIEGFITFSFYEYLKPSAHRVKNFIIVACAYVTMAWVNVAFDYNPAVNALFLVGFQFLFADRLYDLGRMFSMMCSVLIACSVTITEISVVNGIAYFMHVEARSFIKDPNIYALVIVFSKALLFVILRVILGVINRYRANEKFNFWILVYPITLLLVLTDFVIISYYTKPSGKILLLISVSSLVLVISVIMTCTVQQRESRKAREDAELRAFHHEQELNTAYFELLEHQNEILQTFVHDTKKHYANLYDLAESPEKLRVYIENIVNDIDKTNRVGKTSNKLLDLIINKYDYECDKENICFEKNINQSELSFMSDSDMTSIFNNLFDNAIEAAQKTMERRVELNISKVRNMVVIDISNSCETPPTVRNNKLVSTKNTEGIHGYGFKSVCRAVKKYKGEIEWEYKDDAKEFSVSILIPEK